MLHEIMHLFSDGNMQFLDRKDFEGVVNLATRI